MAAVFALVFLPALAAIGFMFKSGEMDARTVFAVTLFTMMAAGVFYGALRLAKDAEGSEDH
jgi:hypothetical protein